ncbi:VQ motif-containing protein 9-like [Typha angustifolia]|uniref:VQ motif-containing protein 9-like n=1 Tax=Typha angustifolia TaxID=59011 RepID=UPI003C300847
MENSSQSTTTTTTATVADKVIPIAADSADIIPVNSSACSSSISTSLKSLNKASYKISKPVSRNSNPSPSPARPAPPPPASGGGGGVAPPLQPQPPVYNIDKNDFRDVVQKLTGQIRSPAPARAPGPQPPPPAATAVTSRLHRIRPPPLASLAPRPPPQSVVGWTRPLLSPLPPLPAVSAAAESPISAYMRRLHSGGISAVAPSPTAGTMVLPPPTSPLGFGCLPSPLTAYQMMMMLPTSPGVPMPSPR